MMPFKLQRLIEISLILVIFWVGCSSNGQPPMSEREMFTNAKEVTDPAERAAALETFVKRFPQSKQVGRAYREMFSAYLELGNEEKALWAAEKYLEPIPENRRAAAYNFLAWSLAVKKMGLSAADKYSALAEEWARGQNNPRTLRNILDTRAYVLYQLGDAQNALILQTEAIVGNEEDPEFLGRLALYLEASGRVEEALVTVVRSILYGGSDEDVQHFSEWMTKAASTSEERQQLKEKIVLGAVNNFLSEKADRKNPDKLAQAALLFAKTGVRLNTAEKWARQAYHSLNERAPLNQRIFYHLALAKVYYARGKYSRALEIFQPVEQWAPPWDTDSWFTLGQLYEKTGDDEAAIRAYIQGLLYRPTERLHSALEAVHQRMYGNNEGIAEKIEQARQNLLHFKPGQYQPEKTTGRVVLAELFTGAECPPCAASDKAFDALAEYFPRTAVAILEYHLHIPAPDPMTNPDTEARYRHYGGNFGTPTVFLNGTEKISGGGPAIAAKHRFTIYREVLEKQLTTLPPVRLSGAAVLQNDRVTVRVKVAAGQRANKFSSAVGNIALVERSVEYPGGNGIDHHIFVVRKLLTAAAGDALQWKNGAAEIEGAISLEQVESELAAYLDEYIRKHGNRFHDPDGWRARPIQLNRANLAVIAWVQDSSTGEVLQAWYQDIAPLTAEE